MEAEQAAAKKAEEERLAAQKAKAERRPRLSDRAAAAETTGLLGSGGADDGDPVWLPARIAKYCRSRRTRHERGERLAFWVR